MRVGKKWRMKYSVNKFPRKIALWNLTSLFESYSPRDIFAAYHDLVRRY